MRPREVIPAFDRYLAARGLRFEAVAIGGTALNLLGVINRSTNDCDILDPTIPIDIADAAQAFAVEQRNAGNALADDWLNNRPASLVPNLPPGWQEQLQVAFSGTAMELRSLGRLDLLRSKLFALCDRAIDLADCLALAPSATELAELLPWIQEQDANPDWPAHVQATLADLGRRLGHGA